MRVERQEERRTALRDAENVTNFKAKYTALSPEEKKYVKEKLVEAGADEKKFPYHVNAATFNNNLRNITRTLFPPDPPVAAQPP